MQSHAMKRSQSKAEGMSESARKLALSGKFLSSFNKHTKYLGCTNG